jgi:hypothetical protein
MIFGNLECSNERYVHKLALIPGKVNSIFINVGMPQCSLLRRVNEGLLFISACVLDFVSTFVDALLCRLGIPIYNL